MKTISIVLILVILLTAIVSGYFISEKLILSLLESYKDQKNYNALLNFMRTSRLMGIFISIPGYGIIACFAYTIKRLLVVKL
jgi:hypothetical protein